MARGLLANLTRASLHVSIQQPVFVPLVANELGDASSVNDGNDADIQALLAQTGSDDNLVSSTDQDLQALNFNRGDIQASVYQPVVDDHAGFVSNGEGQVDILA